MIEKSIALREKKTSGDRSNEIKLKIAATQNVMKNKFEKAYTNRVEHEYNLNQAIEPLRALSSPTTTINESDSPNEDDSLRKLTKSKNIASQLRLATKSYSNLAIKSRPMATTSALTTTTPTKNSDSDIIHNYYSYNPNALCDRLRQIANNANQIEEINNIIAQLRDLDIIV